VIDERHRSAVHEERGVLRRRSAHDDVARASGATAGLVTAQAAGTTSIKATLGTISGTTSVTVTAPTLTTITISPATATIVVGGTSSFTAQGSYADGSTADLTDSVTWSSSDTTVLSLSNATGTRGQAHGLGPGHGQRPGHALDSDRNCRCHSHRTSVGQHRGDSQSAQPARRAFPSTQGHGHIRRPEHAGRDSNRNLDRVG